MFDDESPVPTIVTVIEGIGIVSLAFALMCSVVSIVAVGHAAKVLASLAGVFILILVTSLIVVGVCVLVLAVHE